ncbi:hypothetical protein ALC57_07508 [Trachymyrmex cornetzi]|uniref:Uncharacterized protein n=1 Tax=Trachymyrmex cornetzi TaxID=471704 RepID=A0A195E5Q0_9HYME|nr:hypothetical protein ALC57_07508 [Trachymyrmex cornetzi]
MIRFKLHEGRNPLYTFLRSTYDFLVVVPSTFRSATVIDQHTADLLFLLACLVPHSAAGLLHRETHFPFLNALDQFRAASSTQVPFAQL